MMTVVSTSQSLLPDAGQQSGLMVLQVWLHVVVAPQGAHDEEAATRRIRFSEKLPVLQHLKADGRRRSVQSNHVNLPPQRSLQKHADLDGPCKHRLVSQPLAEQHGDIDIARGMRGTFGHGAE